MRIKCDMVALVWATHVPVPPRENGDDFRLLYGDPFRLNSNPDIWRWVCCTKATRCLSYSVTFW